MKYLKKFVNFVNESVEVSLSDKVANDYLSANSDTAVQFVYPGPLTIEKKDEIESSLIHVIESNTEDPMRASKLMRSIFITENPNNDIMVSVMPLNADLTDSY